jgi:hypothetical protein
VYASRDPLTKLAIASIAAAPSWLSDADLADLHCMGYRDAEDVAARIQVSGQRLPVPLSVIAGSKAALTAQTCRELAALTANLPAGAVESGPAPKPRRRGQP